MTSQVRFTCPIAEQSNPRDEPVRDFETILRIAQNQLALQLRSSEDDLLLVLRRRVTWPQGELRDEITEGFHIVFQSKTKEHQYCVHTNLETDSFIFKLHKTERKSFMQHLEIFAHLPRCSIQ